MPPPQPQPRLPYSRRWKKGGKIVQTPIEQDVADRLREPRVLGGAEVVYFAFVDETDDGGYVVDETAREVALLLEQAAAWLRERPDRMPLSVALIHEDESLGARMRVLLVAE